MRAGQALPLTANRSLIRPALPSLYRLGPPDSGRWNLRRRPASAIEFSPDASQVVVVDGEGISLLDTQSRKELRRLEVAGVSRCCRARCRHRAFSTALTISPEEV